MIKQRFKKIVSLLSVVAASFLTATSFFVLNNNNLFSSADQKSTDLQADTASDNLATNYSNDSLAFKDDTYSEPNTPIGYLQTSQGYVYLVSWFGNEMWKYNVQTSPFLTNAANGAAITISKLNIIYLSNYDRVLVYGIMNTNISFVFQLNNEDGSEYYVNSSSTNKVAESSLISSTNQNVIANVNSVSLLTSDTAIMMPKKFDGNKLVCTRFSLVNYSIVPTTYDITGSSSSSSLTGVTLDEVFGLMTNNTNTYLALKGYGTSNTADSYDVKLIIIKLVNNIFSYASVWTYTPIPISGFDIDNAIFTFKTVFTSSGPKAYVAMLKNDDDTNSYNTNIGESTSTKLVYIDPTKENSSITDKDPTLIGYDFQNNYPYYITEIYTSPNQSKAYLLLRSKDDYSKYYLLDTSANITAFNTTDTFSVNGVESSSTNRASVHLRIIPEDSSNGSINGIISIYKYGDGSSTVSKTLERFTLSNSSSSSSKYDLATAEWKATEINSFLNLSNDFPKYLPQDITLDFLKKYIYLKNIDSSSNLNSADSPGVYSSNITVDSSHNLSYDNSKGIVSGYVILNLTKWWNVSSSSSATDSIIVPVNLSGFATTSELYFSLVKSSDDDSNKWSTILSLEKNNFPSVITANQILTNFILQGSKIGLTESDIALVNSTLSSSESSSQANETKAITVYSNDDDGTLKIVYDLSNLSISPNISNKTGDYTYYNFKSKNAYSQVTLNESAWQSLKKSKAVFQVTISDIISCLNLTSGYKTDTSYWTWKPDADEKTNKTTYINNCIDGNLTGTISYNASMDTDATTVTNGIGTVTISTEQGKGFISLTTLLGTNNETSVYYNEAQASKIASSYSYDKVITEFSNILSSSILFYNGWTTSDSLTYNITSSANNKITFTLGFKDEITTTIKNANGTNLVLDSEWISTLKSKTSVLTFPNSLSFDYDLTNIVYSYGLSVDNNKITIDDLVKDTSNNNELLEKYLAMLPYQFVKSFYDSQNGSYDGFESAFNIIATPTDTTAVNYYTVTSVQMVANDTNGTVTVFYTVSFPNSGSVVGSSSTASVVISGFKSTTAVANMWTIICASVGGVIGLATISLLCYFLITKFKYSRNRSKYGLGSTDSGLNLETVNYRKNIYDKNKGLKVRNTINKNTLTNKDNRKISQGIKSYNKMQKEISKKP